MRSIWPSLSRVLLHNPLALLGWRLVRIGRHPEVTVRACCRVCDHYELPGNSKITLDGGPGACCKHPECWNGRYVNAEFAEQLGLARRPGDWCERFELQTGLNAEDES